MDADDGRRPRKVDDMTLSDDDYRRIGISIMARLLAINRRTK